MHHQHNYVDRLSCGVQNPEQTAKKRENRLIRQLYNYGKSMIQKVRILPAFSSPQSFNIDKRKDNNMPCTNHSRKVFFLWSHVQA